MFERLLITAVFTRVLYSVFIQRNLGFSNVEIEGE